ncbi:glycine zipper 2TM domain-containing protein [Rhodoferax sp.]|uniref:glycine zipper 2TM domain-containing protein n=1 Tax=Rhodoferax sp. TaxID=50421 RepID=UPI0025E0BF00|nr:glycine zipper 2TM domain-containing protein [Rhodoferax sp.]
MKSLVIASVFATTLLGAHAATFNDNARVRSAEPQYENISVPRNECSSHWINEPVGRVSAQPQNGLDRQYGGAIVGGLAGGVLGHQVGNGRGKDAATVLGVVLGAMAGDRLQNSAAQTQYDNRQYDNGRYETAQREVQRCRTVYDAQTRITGYNVAYEYRGQQYTTFMQNNPGNSLPVRVSVEPIQP